MFSIACLGIEQLQWRGVGALFDFVGVVWSAYPNLANYDYYVVEIEETSGARTTAIISYNIAASVCFHYSEEIDVFGFRRLFAW